MSLMKCPECNRKVSSEARLCPHCGYNIQNINNIEEISDEQNKKEKDNKKTMFILIGAIVAIIAIVLIEDALTVDYYEANESFKASYKEYNETKDELDDLNAELNANQQRIEEILGDD